MTATEQRGATRYKGALQVDVEGVRAMTRDFSTSGIFFETDRAFSSGQPIDFAIMMEHLDASGPVCLKCTGEIVRVETKGSKIGVAAAISSYYLEKAESKKKKQRAAK